MALLDNSAMYSSMMSSSYLLHQNAATAARINLEWSTAAAAAQNADDLRAVARVAPSQRHSTGSAGSGSPLNNSGLDSSPLQAANPAQTVLPNQTQLYDQQAKVETQFVSKFMNSSPTEDRNSGKVRYTESAVKLFLSMKLVVKAVFSCFGDVCSICADYN